MIVGSKSYHKHNVTYRTEWKIKTLNFYVAAVYENKTPYVASKFTRGTKFGIKMSTMQALSWLDHFIRLQFNTTHTMLLNLQLHFSYGWTWLWNWKSIFVSASTERDLSIALAPWMKCYVESIPLCLKQSGHLINGTGINSAGNKYKVRYCVV